MIRSRSSFWIPLLFVFPFLLMGCEDSEVQQARAQYDAFVDGFLAWHFADQPVRATRLGVHDHNHALPDLSRDGQARRTADLNDWLGRLEAIDADLLSSADQLDYQVLDHAIRSDLLELEEIRWWTKNPSFYIGTISGGISGLADRDFAPLEERMDAILRRQSMIPQVLDAARENLDQVPELWARQAIGAARGTARYLREDLSRALEAQGLRNAPSQDQSRFSRGNEAAADEMEAFAAWLEEDLLPRADGDFRLGADLFERKLRYDEHVDLSVAELREINEREIERYREWIAEVAAEIDPDRDPAEVMEEITSEFPSPEELIPTAEQYQRDLQAFIRENDIVTLPTDDRPTVRETPDYARGGFASMSTPGPFETRATEAYYNITNVLPEWTDAQKREHLTYFNYPGLLGITVHESFPGHFVDFLYRPLIESRVRKVFNWGSLSEGWAHYTEQMMVDEGLGDGDPAIRLGQLRRAIQRHARWYAGLEMHALGADVEEATDRYQEIAYFARFPALQEVERGTRNPTYLYYALGRMQILQLREDYREYLEEQGETFSLRDFHDRFLQIGLPVSLARQVLIPGDERGSLR
ncbi:MAG: DUF885 domain-containing protein [Gemmatimonadales bacterium]|nr:MAG: DUF885 domain-containing protein [Gemmatimonadales bacterium]